MLFLHLMNCWKKITVSILNEHLQTVAIEKYKISNNMSPAILNNIFARSATPYNLHNPANLKMRKVHLVLRLYPI